MPCRDDGYPVDPPKPRSAELNSAYQSRAKAEVDLVKLQEENNKLTRTIESLKKQLRGKAPKGPDLEGMLCDVLTIVENQELTGQIPKDILEWWDNHTTQETDKIKTEALAKLSEREKRVLGLK